MLDEKFIAELTDNHPYDYVLRKAAEECLELAVVLLQQVNKPTKDYTDNIIEEAGHVLLRIDQLKYMYGSGIHESALKKQDYLKEKFTK